MNKQILIALLVLEFNMGVNIYLTQVYVEFKRPNSGQGMKFNEYQLAFFAPGDLVTDI